MNGEICFCIEGVSLYLDEVLVEYNAVPVFFLCQNNRQYYSVLCTDIDELHYIVVKSPQRDVYHMLHGKLPMRDIFLNAREFWKVISGENVLEDSVVRYGSEQMDTSVLPEREACFKILTEEIKSYVRRFDREFWNFESEVQMESSAFSDKRMEANDIRIYFDNGVSVCLERMAEFKDHDREFCKRMVAYASYLSSFEEKVRDVEPKNGVCWSEEGVFCWAA